MDYYLDIITEMLLRMAFSPRISINLTDDLQQFKNETIRVLSRITNTFDDTYNDFKNMVWNFMENILVKQLTT